VGLSSHRFCYADEINRAPAKTQSACAASHAGAPGDHRTGPHIPCPVISQCFATQNPVEYEGTYPLPEAQKDRIMLKILMPLPNREEELELAQRMMGMMHPKRRFSVVTSARYITPGVLATLQQSLQDIAVRTELIGYIVDTVRATRQSDAVLVGAGPPRYADPLLLASRVRGRNRRSRFCYPR
jgi:MoxR-like ATPase